MSSMVLRGREVTAASGSRLAVAAGVDNSGKLSITAAFLLHLPAAAVRDSGSKTEGLKYIRKNVEDSIDVETFRPF